MHSLHVVQEVPISPKASDAAVAIFICTGIDFVPMSGYSMGYMFMGSELSHREPGVASVGVTVIWLQMVVDKSSGTNTVVSIKLTRWETN